MKSRILNRGSLHLPALLAVVVMAAVAGIGVKVLNMSHANPLGDRLISVSVPTANATVTGFTPLKVTVTTKRTIRSVSYQVNGTEIKPASPTSCTPAVPSAMTSQSASQSQGTTYNYAACWDSKSVADGAYKLVVKVVFVHGAVATTDPVSFKVDNSLAAAPYITIVSPQPGAQISRYVPVTYKTDIPKTIAFTLNGVPVKPSTLVSCYPNGLPPVPIDMNMYQDCIDVQSSPAAAATTVIIGMTGSDINGKVIIRTQVSTVFASQNTFTVSFNGLKDGSTVQGLTLLSIHTSSTAKDFTFTINHNASVNLPISNCFNGVMPMLPPDTYDACVDFSNAPYDTLSGPISIIATAHDLSNQEANATISVFRAVP